MPIQFLKRTLLGEQRTMPAVTPRRTQRPGPNETQKYQVEHYNAASDYVYGLENRGNGVPALTMDEYISLLREFGSIAMTLDRSPSYAELEELVEMLDKVPFEEEGLLEEI